MASRWPPIRCTVHSARMETPTLDDFVAWNDQLAALVDAGVPLGVSLGAPGTNATEAVKRINATVARRVKSGESLSDAVEDDEQVVPSSYRSLVQLALRSGDLASALDGSNRVAESVDDSRFAVRSSFIYPLIVCCLAFVGLILFCIYLVPSLAAMYSSLRLRRGSGLRVLQLLRESLPYWMAIPPIVLLLYLIRLWQTKRKFGSASGPRAGALSWLPGMKQALFQERCASFSDSLAKLVASEVPIAEALPLAAHACGDSRLVGAAESLAAAIEQGQTPMDDSPVAKQFPPFLRWALLHSDATVGRARALQMAAGIYRESAQRRQDKLRIIAPIVVCVLLGGGATLLYGLSLFVPVVQLLRAIAS
jgi:general secretion pathway protein F